MRVDETTCRGGPTPTSSRRRIWIAIAARILFVTLFTAVHATATLLLILANFALSETSAAATFTAATMNCALQLMCCFMPLFGSPKNGDYGNNDDLAVLLVLNGFLWSLPMLLIAEVLWRRARRVFSTDEPSGETDRKKGS